MTVVFVSNFLNHHQIPFCEKMLTLCDTFRFVATDIGSSQGYQVSCSKDYVVDYSKEKQTADELIKSADAVIFGACPSNLVEVRMKDNKLSFLYSERFFKKGTWRRFIPKTRKALERRIGQYRDKNMYVLCASAYLPYDLSLLNFPENKCYKWGYFPAVKRYDSMEALVEGKKKNSILWAARMLPLKHPEYMVFLAERLTKENIKFDMNLVGDGEMFCRISELIKKKNLQDRVHMIGSLDTDTLREYMENSEVFLFTSNRREGWGAVLNESMNSGCAVVTSSGAGASSFLIEQNKNGFVYKFGNKNEMFSKVKYLLTHEKERKEMSLAALSSITGLWNADLAAERFMTLVAEISEKGECTSFETGPCSKAKIVKG